MAVGEAGTVGVGRSAKEVLAMEVADRLAWASWGQEAAVD